MLKIFVLSILITILNSLRFNYTNLIKSINHKEDHQHALINYENQHS